MALHPAPTGNPQQAARPRRLGDIRLLALLSALLAMAVLFGAGGVRYGLANLTVQLLALAILAFHRDAFFGFWKEAPTPLRILTASTLAIPIFQLIPLPEAVWQALPGRDLVAQSRAAAGLSGWAPASVDPARTMVALSGMVVPLVMLTVGWSAPRRDLLTLGWVVVALGLLCFVIGIPQVLSGGSAFRFYDERPPTAHLLATFANRNSTGIFLASALTLAALLPLPLARPHPLALPARLAICALLAVGIILTQSRTAVVLAIIPAALGLLRAFAGWRAMAAPSPTAPTRTASRRPLAALLAAIALGAVAAGALFTFAPGRVGDILERFEAQDDPRRFIWDDAAYSASRYWPVGSGMGTFDEVFQIDESLENMAQRRAGRAHNDFLELAIEAGFAGIAIAACWLLLAAWYAWKARTSSLRWAAWGGAAILLAIGLQSITDYPLRNQAMLAAASFALLLLARIVSVPPEERGA